MKVLICGAGQVGSHIAEQLAREHNEVTVIDQNAELIQKINESLDVTGHVGHASHPNVLERAGAADADMLVAVTHSDEVNMVACQIGYSLFSIPTKVARVRHQNYLNPVWKGLYSNDNLAVDVIISPEVEVAEAILRRLHMPGTLDTIPFANDKLRVISVRCMAEAPIINLPLSLIRKKAKNLQMNIIGAIHGGKFSVPTEETIFHPGDDVYFIAPTEEVRKVMALFGHEEHEARRIVILGGGNVGLYVAEAMERDDHDVKIKLIEYARSRAEYVAGRLHNSTVIHGSALDREILMEAGIDYTETVIAVTNDDETNILSSLLATRYGAERSMTLVNNTSYAPLISTLGVDVVINPYETTVSSILQHVRRGKISAVHSIANGSAEIVEAVAVEMSPLVGKSVEALALPKGVVIGAIIHQGKVIIPTPETVIHEGDRVIMLTSSGMVKKVERIFSVSLEFF